MCKRIFKITGFILLFLISIFSQACTTAKCEIDRQICKFNCPATILLKQACEIGCDVSYDTCRAGGAKKEETPKSTQNEGNDSIKTDKKIYNYGEKIKVNFNNAPGDSRDWICIAPAGSPDTDPGDWKYIPRKGNGVLTFKSPQPGNYEARAYYRYKTNQYEVSARYSFTVK